MLWTPEQPQVGQRATPTGDSDQPRTQHGGARAEARAPLWFDGDYRSTMNALLALDGWTVVLPP